MGLPQSSAKFSQYHTLEQHALGISHFKKLPQGSLSLPAAPVLPRLLAPQQVAMPGRPASCCWFTLWSCENWISMGCSKVMYLSITYTRMMMFHCHLGLPNFQSVIPHGRERSDGRLKDSNNWATSDQHPGVLEYQDDRTTFPHVKTLVAWSTL